MIQPTWRPYIILGIGVLAVSSASIMIRLAQQENASSLAIGAWRLGLAALLLTPIVLSRYRAELKRLTRHQLLLAMLSGALLGAHFATWITSLEYTSVISSVVLVTTNPLWVAVASPFLLHERLSRSTVIGILIAISGVILISISPDAGTAHYQNMALLGNALALIGAVSVAGNFIIGRRLRATISLVPYIWITYGSASIVLLAAMLLSGPTLVGLTPTAYLWMTLLALLPQLVGHSSYNYALGYLSAAYVSLTVLGEPIGSTILAALFLKEIPKPILVGQVEIPVQLVGGALILLALVIASREEARALRRLQQQAAAT